MLPAASIYDIDFNNILDHPEIIAVAAILALLLLVFVPLMVWRAVKQSRTARNYIPDFMRMSGLQQTDKATFSGEYNGFPTTMTFGLGVNYASMAAESIGGLMGGRADFHRRNLLAQKFNIDMVLPKEVPPLVLKQKVGMLRTDQYVMDLITKKGVELPQIKLPGISLKRAKIFCADEGFARQVASSEELQKLLKTWHFLDVRLEGNKLKFILDDVMSQEKFGKRTAKPDHPIQALDICVAIGRAV